MVVSERHRYQPLTYWGEELDDEVDDTVNIQLLPAATDDAATIMKVVDKLFVLDSRMTNEKFIKAWMHYKKRIWNRKDITFTQKMDVLQRITIKRTEKILAEALSDISGEDVDSHIWKWQTAQIKMRKLREEGLLVTQYNTQGKYRVKMFC